jgi:hypothetical protein
MQTLKTRNCLFCKTEFQTKHLGRPVLYCSKSCKQRNYELKKQSLEKQILNKRNPPAESNNPFVFCVDCNCFFDFNQAHDFKNQGRPRSTSLCPGCSKKRKRNCANCFKEFLPVSTSGYNACYCRSCVRQMRKMHKKGFKIKDNLEIRECLWCLKPFAPKSNRSQSCSRHCTLSSNGFKRLTSLKAPCSFLIICDCGKLIGKRFHKCSDCVFKNQIKKRGQSMARRYAAERQGDAGIHWRVVGDRDDWLCHLCGEEVLKKAGTAYEPFGATVDHLIPIAKDGTHTWGNVALAHRHCNVVRGADDLEVPNDES